jgi:hypothetical protein
MKVRTVVFSLLTNLFTVYALAISPSESWSGINVPTNPQVTQIEAGLLKGCSITTVFYALKLGPSSWRYAYENLPGDSDVQKLKSLATKFSAMLSENSKGQLVFTEKYGSNPNDIPQMFKSLVKGKVALSQKGYFLPAQADFSQRNEFFKKFYSDLFLRLSSGHPIPLALYFANPEASHAVLVTGLQNSIDQDGSVKILVLDPLTGKVSSAAVNLETFPLFDARLAGFSFSDLDVADRKGFIFSISL